MGGVEENSMKLWKNSVSVYTDAEVQKLTSAHAFKIDSFSSVATLSLYSVVALEVFCNFVNEDTNNWWTLRRSFKSLATPLPIQALHTAQAAAVTWLAVSFENAGLNAAPTYFKKFKFWKWKSQRERKIRGDLPALGTVPTTNGPGIQVRELWRICR